MSYSICKLLLWKNAVCMISGADHVKVAGYSATINYAKPRNDVIEGWFQHGCSDRRDSSLECSLFLCRQISSSLTIST